MVTRATLACALLLSACGASKADDRFHEGQKRATATLKGGVTLQASPARIHQDAQGEATVRAASPQLAIQIDGPGTFTISNIDPYSRFSPEEPATRVAVGPTSLRVSFAHAVQTHVDPLGSGPARFAVISDIHNNLATFTRFSELVQAWRPDMVLCMGDLTLSGKASQFEEVFSHLGDPGVPLYTTAGNHELMDDAIDRFEQEIGPTSVAFQVRGVQILLVDSAGAMIAPDAYPWIAGQLAPEKTGPRLVLTHIPPLDPWGSRNHAFSVRDDAEHFLQVLAEGSVDHVFAGHIHSWADYSLRGIPATLSGGGGGQIESLVDVGHHYLQVVVDPLAAQPISITRVPLD